MPAVFSWRSPARSRAWPASTSWGTLMSARGMGFAAAPFGWVAGGTPVLRERVPGAAAAGCGCSPPGAGEAPPPGAAEIGFGLRFWPPQRCALRPRAVKPVVPQVGQV